jgi:hypothetical protein
MLQKGETSRRISKAGVCRVSDEAEECEDGSFIGETRSATWIRARSSLEV